MSDSWNTAPVAPAPIFDKAEEFDASAFFPAPEPPPPLMPANFEGYPNIPLSDYVGTGTNPPPFNPGAAPLHAERAPVVTTDPWHEPWIGPCSPEMASEIEALLASGVEFEQPEDSAGAKYPLMRLEPRQSLVWQCPSMAEARILHNRVNVYINRVTKRSGRHFKVKKHQHGPDMISLEVTRII